MECYLVGGAVRDELMNYPFHERDWVIVGATEQDLENMIAEGYQQVGKDFPVFLHPDSKEEYALARTERKTGHGYGGFSVNTENVSLEDDLSRRDLTINAIAKSADGKFIDPYGGLEDLNNRILRHVSDAFAEDPLRILRIARFVSRYTHLGFTIAPETQQLMKNMVAAGEVEHLVPERVWKETERALGERSPSAYFECLRGCGALHVLMPELDDLFGVPQRAEYHPEIDTGLHSLMVLEQACKLSEEPRIRLAAVLHDLGKAKTPADILPRHHGHEQRSLPLIRTLCERLRIPKAFLRCALHLAEFHTLSHRAMELRGATLAKLFKQLDAYRNPQALDDFLLGSLADSRGRTGFEEQPYPQTDYLKAAFEIACRINAKEIIAQGYSGADIGVQLEQQRINALEHYRKEKGKPA
ncbi:multifunctional CCA addition/repair protein [Pseudoteredinibacter isoporae]|uniref:Multifunctional CCA protein n=1 Tax=Pseudoteredinibacter isoporae TaxID=570281 RepID=A0A7X0JSP5_9GAMM|nr:multifunctional CCA addition/repair protein [Pseudoteredinibacter isoporae]MBB6521159.1 tRNA nucleotidyltransferase (CCA-adding enzyme) [Pseudoteredinibacter isoporae]NHO86719.1 multifunctional CCA addition/repair protein [Pseudoteredinibacter isoporae]NIB24829.1 multifunctional CCA addition/repair protein [Pseudoteredinibacter isoporae]